MCVVPVPAPSRLWHAKDHSGAFRAPPRQESPAMVTWKPGRDLLQFAMGTCGVVTARASRGWCRALRETS